MVMMITVEMSAMSLLGYPSWQSSQKYVIVNPMQYVTSLALIFPKRADYEHISGISGMQKEGWTSAEGTEAGAKGAMANKEARQMASA